MSRHSQVDASAPSMSGTADDAPGVPGEARAEDLLLRGVRVRYTEVGEGQPVLLIHGAFSSAKSWRRLLPHLQVDHRLIALDLPGFGESEKSTRYPHTREAFAETLCDLLAGIGVPRAHVVGHDLGGEIAITLAADHPEVVDRIVVINTVTARVPLPPTLRLARMPVVGSVFLKQFYNRAAFHGHFRNAVYTQGEAYEPAMVDAWFDAFDPPEARECALRTLQSFSDPRALGPRISRVRAPGLVIWGERDPYAPMHLGRRLATELAGARFAPIARAGRSPHEEAPEPTADAIRRHLRPAR